MTVDTDATPVLLRIQQKLCIVLKYRYGSLSGLLCLPLIQSNENLEETHCEEMATAVVTDWQMVIVFKAGLQSHVTMILWVIVQTSSATRDLMLIQQNKLY